MKPTTLDPSPTGDFLAIQTHFIWDKEKRWKTPPALINNKALNN
jgi:hypothetical protein